MHAHSRWKNAHPRDYKIDDAAMAKFVALVITSPLLVVLVWASALREAGTLLIRGRVGEALAYAILTPFFTIGETPGYLRALWLRITG